MREVEGRARRLKKPPLLTKRKRRKRTRDKSSSSHLYHAGRERGGIGMGELLCGRRDVLQDSSACLLGEGAKSLRD